MLLLPDVPSTCETNMPTLSPEARMLSGRSGIKRTLLFSLAVVVAGLFTSPAHAQGKGGGKPGGGGGGGGGGSSAAYTILDLPGPANAQSAALQIADVAGTGSAQILGGYGSAFNLPCVWTVDPDGSVAVTDLVGQFDVANDVNSAGIIAGQRDGRPVLLLADGTAVFPADASVFGAVLGMNNPDANGVFQAVGYADIGTPVLWDVDVNGNVLAQTLLEDAGGQRLMALDISDSLLLGGSVPETPAVGAFDGEGQLQIGLLSFPASIDGSYGYQIDDVGNLLAFGYQSASGGGYYPRAVIWPAGGGVIDLTAETGVANTEGNGIALVEGAMQVVGRAHNSRGEAIAYLFAGGSLVDLGPLSQGSQSWTLQRAEGVNTSGMICGQGRVGSKRNFQIHGFVLIPNAP
jgi:probable HAF family extracellular repeat protein